MSEFQPDDYEVTIYDAMVIVAPRLQAVLKRHRIKIDFEQLCEEIVHFLPDYDVKIFSSIASWELAETLIPIFNFTKSTAYDMRIEFLSWLKKYWQDFAADNADEVLGHIRIKLQLWNDEHPEQAKPKINWIPMYGGLMYQLVYDPTQAERSYMQENNQPYPLTGEAVTFNRK
jgi:uncharacterized membrane protein YoaT (DUF817 family)